LYHKQKQNAIKLQKKKYNVSKGTGDFDTLYLT